MPFEQLIDRVARANAYPREHGLPEGWLGGDLDADTRGTDIMSTIHEMKPTETEPRTSNVGRIAAVAAVVVALAIAAFVLREQPDVTENVTTTTTAADPADLQRDVTERVATLLYSADAQALTEAVVDAGPRERLLAFQTNLIAGGTTLLSIEACENLEIGFRARCTLDYRDDVMRELDVASIRVFMTITFTDETGTEIFDFTVETPSGTRTPVYDDFFEWGLQQYGDSPECAGREDDGLADDLEACWAFILSVIPEFKESEAYNPQP